MKILLLGSGGREHALDVYKRQTIIRSSVCQVTAMQVGISSIDTNIREQVQFFSFQTIFVGFLIVGNCRIRAVQLHPHVAFDIINIG